MTWRTVLRDQDGNIIMDLPTRITRRLGTATVTAVDGSVTDAALAEAGARVWWKFVGGNVAPKAQLNGTTISWQWGAIPTAQRGGRRLVYGLF